MHAIEYPPMSSGSVSVTLATSIAELTPLSEEMANDLEVRANLSPGYWAFEDVGRDTWAAETWFVRYKSVPVGYIVIRFDRTHNTFSLSVAIKKEYRDTGIGIKGLALIFRYAFDVLGARKLETSCYGYNLRSKKIYSSFLRLEGVRKDSIYWGGKYWDMHLFGLDRDEFQQRRDKLDRLLINRNQK